MHVLEGKMLTLSQILLCSMEWKIEVEPCRSSMSRLHVAAPCRSSTISTMDPLQYWPSLLWCFLFWSVIAFRKRFYDK